MYQTFCKTIQIKKIDELKGNKLLMQGKINFHAEYGLSIIINAFSSEYTLGQLQKKQQNIVLQLTQEGIINKNKVTSL